MRGLRIYTLVLAIVSLCAQASPVPSHHSIRQQTAAHRSPVAPPSLHKRQSRSASTAVKAIESAALEAPKDWKRPLVIMISGIGTVSTIGWNYVSLRSFLNNRAKYRKEKERMDTEKNKPLPKMGDTLCAVETYTTMDEVQRRKPRVVKRPCYVLGAREEGGKSSSGVVPSHPRESSHAGHSASDDGGPSAVAAPASAAGPSRVDGSSTGGRMKKRGVASASAIRVEEIVEEASHDLRPSSPPSVSYWHSPPAPAPDEERARLISSLPQSSAFPRRPSTLSPRPGFPRANLEMASPSHERPTHAMENDASDNEEKATSKTRAWKRPWKWAKGKKISTEDLTFGVTVLNTVGSVPSLVLTTLNAYYYRGNPRVD